MTSKPAPYPRDLKGYGRKPPDAKWPGGAYVAVQFVMNYEEGGENCILHGDAASEAFLSEIVGAQPWPGQRHMNMESIYEYGARAGFWRLHRMFTERGVPLTVFAVATRWSARPIQVAAMQEADWEIATHGLKWIEYKDFAEADERHHIHEAMRIHTEVTGSRRSACIRDAAPSTRSPDHGGRRLRLFLGQLCRRSAVLDVKGPKGPFLIVPYTLDANDMRFATPQGFNTRRSVLCVPERHVSTCSMRKAPWPAENDVDRIAQPARRTAGARCGAGPLPRLRAAPRQGLDRAPHRYRPPLDCDAQAKRRVIAVRYRAFGAVVTCASWRGNRR